MQELEELRDLSRAKTSTGSANMKQLEFTSAIASALSGVGPFDKIYPSQVQVVSSKVGNVALPGTR